ncbi:hypothetical protein [Candidatus Colwellia aromaticivorans]|uniref:hypothetical protein n=1 Tax=Candidatus Colwellia aromaticivorans TaxID=2267621 RepID=UPI000DF2D755|nr:hypothetical protein [Candidatus Colwellia aromaticivorans]
MFEFKKLSVITACITFLICLVLLIYPEIIFYLFQIPENDSAFFMGRRAAMLFACIAIFSWVGRNASNSESRQAICISISISIFSLALLGVFELVRGFPGAGIGLAIATELIISIAYFQIWLGNKNA